MAAADEIERRIVETVFVVAHQHEGKLTLSTEVYEEKAVARAKDFIAQGGLAYIFCCEAIFRYDPKEKIKRVWKIEKDRLAFTQETI